MTICLSVIEMLRGSICMIALLLLNPLVALLVFVSAAIMAYVFRKERTGWISLIVAVISGACTAFNAFDLWLYQNRGALAISPANQVLFQLFCNPKDLHEPYVRVPLQANKAEYEFSFCHKYGGNQSVFLDVANDHPKKFEYGHPDMIGLKFSGAIWNDETQSRLVFDKKYDTFYLSPGSNKLDLFVYKISRRSDLSFPNAVTVKIDGDLAEFLRKYPHSCLAVRNSTTK